MEPEPNKKDAPKKEHTPRPPPHIAPRPATPVEIPAAARKVADFATTHGWKTLIIYAQGTTDSPRPTLTHSISVRMARDGQRAVAVWWRSVTGKAWKFELAGRRGKWGCGKTGLDGDVLIKMTYAQLKAYIMNSS